MEQYQPERNKLIKQRQKIINLPNYLTITRIFLVPVLVVVLLTKFPEKEIIGGSIFLLASITDLLDGYIARRRKQITRLGTLLDPIADKLLISAAFISLVELRLVPAWMVVIVLGREITVMGLRSIASSQGFSIPSSSLGKFKMLSQVVVIMILILGEDILGKLVWLGTIGMWGVVVAAVVSAIDYTIKFWEGVKPKIVP